MLQLVLFATFVTLIGCDLEEQPRDLFFLEGNKLCDFDCKEDTHLETNVCLHSL